MLEFVVSNNYFEYNGQKLQKVSGTTVVTKLAHFMCAFIWINLKMNV